MWVGAIPQEGTLVDEESQFLRAVNEGYRTWFLRSPKIQQLLKLVREETECQQPSQRLEDRIRQLKVMTVGPNDNQDEYVGRLNECEATMKEVLHYAVCLVEQSLGQGKVSDPSRQDDFATEPGDAGETTRPSKADGQSPVDESAARSQSSEVFQPRDMLEECRKLVQEVEEQIEEAYDSKYTAECELKELEFRMLREWKQTKKESETKSKMHAAWTGLHYVSKAVLMWLEWQNCHPDSFGGVATAPGATIAGESSMREDADPGGIEEDSVTAPGWATWSGSQGSRHLSEVKSGQPYLFPEAVYGADGAFEGQGDRLSNLDSEQGHPPVLSDVIMEGITDPKEREAILKKEHHGSADHPNGCRACHFQGGLCWKGLACSFCHICPKPKRKSKHQRDVDKRRQERYRQVKDDLGIECLDELTKIDEIRRQLMTSSEDLKKRVKDAYGDEDLRKIGVVKDEVSKLMKQCEVTMPLSRDSSDDGESSEEESTSKHSMGNFLPRSSKAVPFEEGGGKDSGAMGSGNSEFPAQVSKVRRSERLPRQQVPKKWHHIMPYGTNVKTAVWPAPEEGQPTDWEHADWQQQQLPHQHRQSNWWSPYDYGQHPGSDSQWWSQAWQPPPGTWSMSTEET